MEPRISEPSGQVADQTKTALIEPRISEPSGMLGWRIEQMEPRISEPSGYSLPQDEGAMCGFSCGLAKHTMFGFCVNGRLSCVRRVE